LLEENDVTKEFRAIENLYRLSKSMFLVDILHVGSFPPKEIKFIDMELCALSLSDFLEIRRRGDDIGSVYPDIEDTTARIIWDIANGVEVIHSCGAVHADLKPSNGSVMTGAKANNSIVFQCREEVENC
jgi:serine/threonine protein kinase